MMGVQLACPVLSVNTTPGCWPAADWQLTLGWLEAVEEERLTATPESGVSKPVAVITFTTIGPLLAGPPEGPVNWGAAVWGTSTMLRGGVGAKVEGNASHSENEAVVALGVDTLTVACRKLVVPKKNAGIMIGDAHWLGTGGGVRPVGIGHEVCPLVPVVEVVI